MEGGDNDSCRMKKKISKEKNGEGILWPNFEEGKG